MAPPACSRRVLIIGGYGSFGGRLIELLIGEPGLTLIAAGRSHAKAEAFLRKLGPVAATVEPAAFDRDGDLAIQLSRFAPDLVVDASGPWQSYGADPYRLPRAVLEASAHYLDLADASGFVNGIAVLDGLAKTRGRFALSGASSFPVLTIAAVRNLAQGLAHLDRVEAGIAPSPKANIGLNDIRALMSYAGKPVALRRAGVSGHATGLIDSRSHTVAVPGHIPLATRRFALVDVPELTMLPALWQGLQDVWTGAGPLPAPLHRLLWLLAHLVRWGVLPSLLPLAPLISWSTGHLRWGEHRGGMYVEITGRDPAGLAVTRSWELIAEGDGGPYIPSMACAAVIRRWLNEMPPPPGARAASDDIGLKDYAAGFAAKGIVTGHRLEQPDGAPLYRRLLGEAYERLAPSIQALHDITATTHFHGQATVTRGNNILAQKIANLFGFPHAASGVPVTVTLTPAAGREIWTRNFAGRSFTSTQEQGQGYFAGLNVERFGPLAFGLAMVERQGQLHLILRRWSAFGIALPRWLAPRNQAFEHDAGDRFNFSVDISLPLIGRLVKYQGYLEPYRAASLPIAST